jgi:Uncharacterized protein with SCP/PR1 domains
MKVTEQIQRAIAILGLVLLLGWFASLSQGNTLFTRSAAKKTESSTQQTAPPPSQEYTREDLLAETNKARADANVAPLTLDPVLNDTAQRKCDDMAARNDYNHGELAPYFSSLDRKNYSENIVYGRPTAQSVISAFINSPSHYKAMIDTRYTRVGFGICPFRDSKLVVQHFSSEPASERQVNTTTESTPAVGRSVDLNPYEYAVSGDTGRTFVSPTINVSSRSPSIHQNHQATPPTVSSGPNYGSSGGCDSSAAQYLPGCN